MRFELIQIGLVNVASHPVLVQSLELVTTLEKCYILDEDVLKRIIGDIFLDIQQNSIEKVFHFLISDEYQEITYESA